MAFSTWITDKDGVRHFNKRAAINWAATWGVLVGTVIFLVACKASTDRLCSNLITTAKTHSVDIAVSTQAWKVASDHPQDLQEELSCFDPNEPGQPNQPVLRVDAVLPGEAASGDEIALLSISSQEGVKSLIAIPGDQVDADADNSPDFQILQFMAAQPQSWKATGPYIAEAVLPEVFIDSTTGEAQTETDGGARVLATRVNREISVEIEFVDGSRRTITPEELRALGPLDWGQLAEDFLTRLTELNNINEVPGVDFGLTGVKYGLPQSVEALIRDKGAAPILLPGEIIGANDGNSCMVAVPDHLVSGEKEPTSADEDGDEVVQYFLNGQAEPVTEGLFQIAVPDGMQCGAFVAKENNPWGYAPGTVFILVWTDPGGAKGEARVVNLENPLKIFWNAENNHQIVPLPDGGFKLIITSQEGTVFEERSLVLAPSYEEMITNAPVQIFWAPEEDRIFNPSSGIERMYIWPVYTGGELVELPVTTSEGIATAVCLPVIMPDPNNPNIIRTYYLPLEYLDQVGKIIYENIIESEQKRITTEEFINMLRAGHQLEALIFNKMGPEKPPWCDFTIACGWAHALMEQQKLSNDLMANGVPDKTILPLFQIFVEIHWGRLYK